MIRITQMSIIKAQPVHLPDSFLAPVLPDINHSVKHNEQSFLSVFLIVIFTFFIFLETSCWLFASINFKYFTSNVDYLSLFPACFGHPWGLTSFSDKAFVFQIGVWGGGCCVGIFHNSQVKQPTVSCPGVICPFLKTAFNQRSRPECRRCSSW